jgi:predicted polyphosphate/ATP-dependent NAD kinase
MSNLNKFTLGFIVNPISGMGGSVGLKGTDGKEILEKALELGAKPNALNRAREFLRELEGIQTKIKFITCSGIMGEDLLKEMQFSYDIIPHPIFETSSDMYRTTAEHTKIAAKIMKEWNELLLIIFVGGDGTARDILDSVQKEKPCLGVPAGVKIYSSVFSLNPKNASNLIMQFLWEEVAIRESEVLDIDEEEYRKGRLVSKLYGYLLTPFNPDFSQFSKMGSSDSDLNNQERIAERIIENLDKDYYYLIGPGTTTKAITDKLKQPKTVLGVDLLLNKQIIAHDLNEQQILAHIENKKVKIIISPIGGQGFIFGRGNLQFTPQVLRKVGSNNIIIICTKFKLQNLPKLHLKLDTRDPDLDTEMSGYYKIITDYDEIKICIVE